VTLTLRNHWLAVSGFLAMITLVMVTFFGQSVATGWMQETSRQAGFILSNLSIEGNVRTRQADILATLDIDTGMPLMAVDLEALQGRVEALPWVRQVTVTRIFPGDINLKIVERQPFALWQRKGQLRLIDNEGIVITRRGLAEFAALPMIVGDGAPLEMGKLFQMLSIAPDLAKRVKTAVRVGDRRWDLLFDNGIRVKLPEDLDPVYGSDKAWSRLDRLEKQHHLLAREVSVIDMRIKNRMIMRVTPAGRRMMDGKEWAT